MVGTPCGVRGPGKGVWVGSSVRGWGLGLAAAQGGQEVKGQLPVLEVEGGVLGLATSSKSPGSVSRAAG